MQPQSLSAEQQLVQTLKVPYQALLPHHLPSGATLQRAESLFDTTTGMLTLRWVFPAQTLPGQGTIILYQYQSPRTVQVDFPAIKDGKHVSFDTPFGRSEGSLGKIERGSVPDAPGQLALRTMVHDRNVMIVSYAISEAELLKIAGSLQ